MIATDDKLPDDIILRDAVISMTCVIKDYCNFYLQILSEEALLVAKLGNKCGKGTRAFLAFLKVKVMHKKSVVLSHFSSFCSLNSIVKLG